MNLITYNGLVAAIPGATRVFFAPHLEQRPDGDPERRFVSMMILYYDEVRSGRIPGPYRDVDAERYARVALIDDEEFAAHAAVSDEELAERFGVPVEQIVAKRTDEPLPDPPLRVAETALTGALVAAAAAIAGGLSPCEARRTAAGELLDIALAVRELVGQQHRVDESDSHLAARAEELAERADELRAALQGGSRPVAGAGERVVSAEIRELAGRLSALFTQDRELAVALNVAQDRLLEANEQLTSGLSAEALRSIYGPGGPDLGLSGRKPAVLRAEAPITALEHVAGEIRGALDGYQRTAEERRCLAMDVGEVNAELQQAMSIAGFTAHEARNADVYALAQGVLRVGSDAS